MRADVQAPRADQAGDGGWNAGVDRLTFRDPCPQRARGDRNWLDLELLHVPVDREAGTGGDDEPREAQDLLRLPPRREVAVFVCPDHDERVGKAALAQAADRAGVPVE